MKKVVVLIGCALVGLSFSANRATAFPQFAKEFTAVYCADSADEAFVAVVKKAKCNVCHDPNKKTEDGKSSKKFKNAYGMALDELLTKDDKKDKEKIHKALKTVEEKKAEGADKTFGELIQAGKLPVETE